MNTKTINKILNKKFSDFVESINSTKVKKLVRENSMITGGCITSMLLQEPVNDFDIYFRNKETAIAVAEYYVKIMNKGEVKVEDDRVKIHIKSKGFAGELPEDGKDDTPFESEEENNQNYEPIYISSNAITLSGKIQIILRFYGDPEDIHENYDFAHCLNYWTSWGEELVLNKEALECTLTKELRYKGSKYPLCSIFRTRKFITRGWEINAGQYLKMAMQLNDMDLNDIETLEDQLTGVDSAYFLYVIESMKEKDTKYVDRAYLTSIIDKIF